MANYKRLIEVDMPIKVISKHARHDQNVKKGHLHTMHVWWATKPLAACRAVILATLLPDPGGPNCPEEFKKQAWKLLRPIGEKFEGDGLLLRKALLEFIAEFSAWENSTNERMVTVARNLVKAAHLGGVPLVVDPFAGMGSIPFEALRLGADAFAGDLNPVAVLLLKTALEYIPTYGTHLAEEVRKRGDWVLRRAAEELGEFYPKEPDGSIPIAYLWARTIRCEGPGCGAEVPLVSLLMLSHKSKNLVALRYRSDKINKKVVFEIFHPRSDDEVQEGTVRRFAATCPVCGYTTPYKRVREQIRAKNGGTHDARLIAVITLKPDGTRGFRLATERDLAVARKASQALERLQCEHKGILPLVPDEPAPEARGPGASRAFSVRKWGMVTWSDLFTPRQVLALATFARLVREAYQEVIVEEGDAAFARAVTTCLSLVVSNPSQFLSALSYYSYDHMQSTFAQGNSISMRPDFAEANPLMPKLVGGFEYGLERVLQVLEQEGSQGSRLGTVHQGSAQNIPLPDQSVPYVVTDPPYYDVVPYADLSDFCYVWLKRMVGELHPELFRWSLTPKAEECIMDPGPSRPGEPEKTRQFFENTMQKALAECKQVLHPDGVAVVLFAHKGTAGWEALLNALIQAGWTVTSSWPIETERGARMRAKSSAVLASSVFLVCHPRSPNAGIGEWRDVLADLQPRVHDWMQRLVKEDIVGADAIFACIGPALEIFSRYERVEKADGTIVHLADQPNGERGYMSYVWEAVAREALYAISKQYMAGADPQGFEEDARLTAMWLWTLRTSKIAAQQEKAPVEDENEEEEEETVTKKKPKGFVLEYDAARKIAQGLGAHLKDLVKTGGIVEIKGKIARLLPVTERRRALFGVEKGTPRKRRRGKQLTLFEEDVPEELELPAAIETGRTILDRLHQAMLLFAEGNLGALKHFLVDEGVGRDDRFWRLAQALCALYPIGVEEKRWVEGVLNRKKSLGF